MGKKAAGALAWGQGPARLVLGRALTGGGLGLSLGALLCVLLVLLLLFGQFALALLE